MFLPFIRGKGKTYLAMWFPEDDRVISLVTLILYVCIIILTIIAYYFRGEDWHINF
jgi:hypothetical protein